MIYVVAKNYANPENLEQIHKLYEELVKLTREEEGCIQYELFSDVKSPEKLTMIETWETREMLDRHLNSDHFTRIVPALKALMAAPGEMSILEKIY